MLVCRIPLFGGEQYSREGAAMVCSVYEFKNKGFVAQGRHVDDGDGEAEHRLMPRTQALPLYTMDEFNYKVTFSHWLSFYACLCNTSAFLGIRGCKYFILNLRTNGVTA